MFSARQRITTFSIVMLSIFMQERKITCNIKIKGKKKALQIGDVRQEAKCTLVFNSFLAFCWFAANPRILNFARLYVKSFIDIEGDVLAARYVINEFKDKPLSRFERTLSRQPTNVHYGWNAKAYALFLDKYMQYTCGVFEDGNEDDLLASQVAKFQKIAEWVDVQPDQRHLDIGCGWLGLMCYFYTQYNTVSHGITLSPEQAAYGRHAYKNPGYVFLGDFSKHIVTFKYDFITVVGMMEHLHPDRHLEFLV